MDHGENLRGEWKGANLGSADERLLAQLLLEFVVSPADAEFLAARMLRQFGTLAKLLSAKESELAAYSGAGPDLTFLLRLAYAISVKVFEPRRDRRRRLADRDRVLAYLGRRRPVPENNIRVLYLDRDRRLIADRTLPNRYPREIVGEGLNLNARAMALIGRDDGLFRTVDDLSRFLRISVIAVVRDRYRTSPVDGELRRIQARLAEWQEERANKRSAHRVRKRYKPRAVEGASRR